MAYNWTHLVRFIAKEDGQVHLGQVDAKAIPDVGLALFDGKEVTVKEVTGDIFSGRVTAKTLTVERVCFLELNHLQSDANYIFAAPLTHQNV